MMANSTFRHPVSTVTTSPISLESISVSRFSPFSLRGWLSLFYALGPLAIAILAIVSAGKVFETRDAASALSSAVNTATLFRLILLCVAGAIISPGLVKFTYPRSTPFIAFFFYVLVCVASAAWSTSTITTVGKALELLVGWLVICFVSSGDSGPDKLRSAMRLVLYFMAIQVVVITGLYLGRVPGFFERGAGGLSQLLGARSTASFISANSIGYFSATLLVCVAGLRFNKLIPPRRAFFLGLIFMATLVCSGSRTALSMAVVGAGLHWTMCRHPSVRGFVFLVAGAAGALAIGPVLDFLQGDVPDDVFYSLSGRTWLWEKAIEAYASNPVIGYGYGVGSRVAFSLLGTQGFNDDISSVHNGILEVLLSVGVIGFIPWCIALFAVVLVLLRYRKGDEVSVVSASTAIVLGPTSVMSLGAGGAMNELLFLFLLAAAGLARRAPSRTQPRSG